VVDHLTCRELQAPLAEALLRAFAVELGPERALAVATRAIEEDAVASGKRLALQMGGNSLREMARVVREVWAEGGALEIEFHEESDTELRFKVTRCRYVDLYDRLGMREFGYCLSCSRDFAFARGFNPRMSLERTTTIMEGAESCDFRVVVE
jgi:hypothetical protein